MLAKYYVTTKGADLSREGPVKVAERIAPKVARARAAQS